MSANEEQTLTVTGGVGPYTWSKVSGGGNLSDSSGTSVTYTAPPSNIDCRYNPTIRVTDGCGNTATLKMAVNAFDPPNAPGFGAYRVNGWEPAFYPYDGSTGWDLYIDQYNCAGKLDFNSWPHWGVWPCIIAERELWCGHSPQCALDYIGVCQRQWCFGGDFWVQAPELCTPGLVWDIRPEDLKYRGCCSEALIELDEPQLEEDPQDPCLELNF